MKSKLKNKELTPTEQLRSDINETGIELTTFSVRSGIEYRRLYRVLKYRVEPSHDEAESLKALIPVLLKEELVRIKNLVQKYSIA